MEREGVLILPASQFGYPGDNHFRLGFGRRDMPEGLELRLERFAIEPWRTCRRHRPLPPGAMDVNRVTRPIKLQSKRRSLRAAP